MPIKKISLRQLQTIVAQYGDALPGWQLAHDGLALVRHEFPIRQQIGFEALSSGAYRPIGGIRALPMPHSRMLVQFLSIPGREMQFDLHERHWTEMLGRMDAQFAPNIRQAINIAEVTALCEREARPTVNDNVMLAILYAWLGDRVSAAAKCLEMQSIEYPALAPKIDWEMQMKDFGRRLEIAIGQGKEREFLELSASSSH